MAHDSLATTYTLARSLPSAHGFRTEPYLKWVILGQASLRIVTPEGKVIYVDLYTGTADDYSLPADLIKQRRGPLDS